MIIEQIDLGNGVKRLTHYKEYFYCVYNGSTIIHKCNTEEECNPSNVVTDSIHNGFACESLEELNNEILNRGLTP